MSYKRIRKRGASKHKKDRIKDFVKQIKELPKDSSIVSIDSLIKNILNFQYVRIRDINNL